MRCVRCCGDIVSNNSARSRYLYWLKTTRLRNDTRGYAQRSVVDACVDNALSDFMANSGKALTSALAPYLNGPFGLDVTARVLRSALAHYSELNAPELLESCREILD